MKCPWCRGDVVDNYQLFGYVVTLMGFAFVAGMAIGLLAVAP